MADATLSTPRPKIWQRANFVQRVAMVLGVILLLVVILAPLIAPHGPNDQSLMARLRPPFGYDRAKAGYWLGTDELGRDMLSRCIYGLRLTLVLALVGSVIGLLLGSVMGLAAGVLGGRVDALISGMVDAQIAVPFTLIALFMLAIFGNSIEVMVVVLGLSGWEQYARIVRADAARLMRMPFIEAARAARATPWRIARRHLLPNLVSPLVEQFTLSVSSIILLESSLSFLGLGVQPPTATLGAMVGAGRDYMATNAWLVTVPAMAILVLTFVVQTLGDWMRDHVDVRLRSR
jgi:peptide/nickel transport system permease protein